MIIFEIVSHYVLFIPKFKGRVSPDFLVQLRTRTLFVIEKSGIGDCHDFLTIVCHNLLSY